MYWDGSEKEKFGQGLAKAWGCGRSQAGVMVRVCVRVMKRRGGVVVISGVRETWWWLMGNGDG